VLTATATRPRVESANDPPTRSPSRINAIAGIGDGVGNSLGAERGWGFGAISVKEGGRHQHDWGKLVVKPPTSSTPMESAPVSRSGSLGASRVISRDCTARVPAENNIAAEVGVAGNRRWRNRSVVKQMVHRPVGRWGLDALEAEHGGPPARLIAALADPLGPFVGADGCLFESPSRKISKPHLTRVR